MATKWMVLMAMKSTMVFAVLAAVNACSNDKPCFYYGSCLSSNGTSSCKCQEGFTGAFCENKLSGFAVCGASYTKISASKSPMISSWIGSGLRLVVCSGDKKCFSGKYKGTKESYTLDISWRGCINTSYCSQACSQVIERETAVRGANVTSCKGSCCKGDFCNALELFVNRTLVVNPCESSPCLNGGTCKYANRNYTCVCQASYSGSYCERYVPLPSTRRPPPRACQSNPCAEKSTCMDINGFYKCVCPARRTGKNCEIYISPSSACQSNPCGFNETCIEDNGNFVCVYLLYRERNCCTRTNLLYTCVVVVLVVVIIALILCIIYLIHRLRKKNRSRMITEDTEHKDDEINPSDIPGHATGEISMSTMIRENVNHAQPDYSSYMGLKPGQDKNTAYQSLDVYANEHIHTRGTDASTQGLTLSGEYTDLLSKPNTHYEKLVPKETSPTQNYEIMP